MSKCRPTYVQDLSAQTTVGTPTFEWYLSEFIFYYSLFVHIASFVYMNIIFDVSMNGSTRRYQVKPRTIEKLLDGDGLYTYSLFGYMLSFVYRKAITRRFEVQINSRSQVKHRTW